MYLGGMCMVCAWHVLGARLVLAWYAHAMHTPYTYLHERDEVKGEDGARSRGGARGLAGGPARVRCRPASHDQSREASRASRPRRHLAVPRSPPPAPLRRHLAPSRRRHLAPSCRHLAPSRRSLPPGHSRGRACSSLSARWRRRRKRCSPSAACATHLPPRRRATRRAPAAAPPPA
eukprot:scaffold23375_cov59-Phaeocystis_antarctica.AAC.1